jgi:hypothetical protein
MFITTTEASDLYGVSQQTLRDACHAGKISFRRSKPGMGRHRGRRNLLLDELSVADWYRQWKHNIIDRPIRRVAGRRGRCLPTVPVSHNTRRAHLRSMSVSVIEADAILAQYDRPVTRGDCEDAPRPCPWIGCKYHLLTHIKPCNGSLVLESTRHVEDMQETCALDVADRGGVSLERVGVYLDITRERVRMIEDTAIEKLRTVVTVLDGQINGLLYED